MSSAADFVLVPADRNAEALFRGITSNITRRIRSDRVFRTAQDESLRDKSEITISNPLWLALRAYFRNRSIRFRAAMLNADERSISIGVELGKASVLYGSFMFRLRFSYENASVTVRVENVFVWYVPLIILNGLAAALFVSAVVVSLINILITWTSDFFVEMTATLFALNVLRLRAWGPPSAIYALESVILWLDFNQDLDFVVLEVDGRANP